MSLPVIIVTGFLGSGKTSFLRHLLPLCKETNQRPALIINEVGDVDIDGECLADIHSEQVRLVGGCVCCTLQSQLTETVYDILDRDVCDMMIIECSGLSNPLDVVSALAAPALIGRVAVSHVVCLLNSQKIRLLLKAVEIAKAQIACADILIMNRADSVEADARAEVESTARELAPEAESHWAAFGDIGHESLLKILTDPAPTMSVAPSEKSHHHHHEHALPASFCTVALPLPGTVDMEDLSRLLETLPENVIRAKGFANVADKGWHVLHRVYDSVHIGGMTTAPSVGAVLICIGQRLSVDDLRSFAASILS